MFFQCRPYSHIVLSRSLISQTALGDTAPACLHARSVGQTMFHRLVAYSPSSTQVIRLVRPKLTLIKTKFCIFVIGLVVRLHKTYSARSKDKCRKLLGGQFSKAKIKVKGIRQKSSQRRFFRSPRPAHLPRGSIFL